MRVIYASDDNYVKLAAISAASLLLHNSNAEVMLLGYRLSPSAIDCFRSRVIRFGGRFRYIDSSAAVAKIEALKAPNYLSYAAYARMFIPELLPDEQGRILYLDCDTLVVDSLAELKDFDLKGKPMAMALDAVHPAYKRAVALRSDQPYFNSGVALIDLAAWRKARFTERFMDELLHPHGRICLPDQDVMARAFDGEIAILSPRWNFLSQFVLYRRQESPAIYHFSGHTLGRPWYTSSKHPIRPLYREIAAQAGLSEVAEQVRPMLRDYRVQYALYRLLPAPLFRFACNLLYRINIRMVYGV